MKRVKARKDAISGESRDGRRELAEEHARTAPSIEGHARFESPHELAVGDERLTRRADLHQCRRPALVPPHARPRRGPVPDQQLDDGRRFPAASI